MKKLQEQILAVIREAETGNPYECVMIASASDPDLWIQITAEMINVSFPFKTAPSEKLTALNMQTPAHMKLIDWDPEIYATWEHDPTDVAGIVGFSLTYLAAVYGSAGSPGELHFERQDL